MNQRGSTLSPASPLGAVGEPSPTTMTCLLCEGSGERRGWETCPECAGRCEVQIITGEDRYGYPIWGWAQCSCYPDGGSYVTRTCGHCDGAGSVEVHNA